jgi:hypothetical protein
LASLQKQILGLFEEVEPDIREVVAEVLRVEQELIHLQRAHGVMDKINEILDRVATASMKGQANEN